VVSAVSEQEWTTAQGLVRLTLPHFARVVILAEDPLPPAILDARQVAALASTSGAEAVEHLDRLDTEGWGFVLVPSAEAWRRADPGLRARIGDGLREVASEDGVRIFALHEAPPPVDRLARDGLPLPPPELIRITAGHASPHRFYQSFVESGQAGARMITERAREAGLEIGEAGAILDFGCGCGRVIRNWKPLDRVRVCGTDYNPYLVSWCRENLPFADFEVNAGVPGLPYEDEAFDLLYSVSVFTHLSESLQRPWIEELHRIVKAGGLVILTLMGEAFLEGLTPAGRKRFTAGEIVVTADERSGTNTCNAYHPEPYLRGDFSAGFEIVAYEPEAAHHAAGRQDLLVLRRI
jgi:SAM-dependent methyltransferase